MIHLVTVTTSKSEKAYAVVTEKKKLLVDVAFKYNKGNQSTLNHLSHNFMCFSMSVEGNKNTLNHLSHNFMCFSMSV